MKKLSFFLAATVLFGLVHQSQGAENQSQRDQVKKIMYYLDEMTKMDYLNIALGSCLAIPSFQLEGVLSPFGISAAYLKRLILISPFLTSRLRFTKLFGGAILGSFVFTGSLNLNYCIIYISLKFL